MTLQSITVFSVKTHVSIYTPHKYIVCGKELNIMQCPGNTCYDVAEHNCVQCKDTREYYTT